MYKLEFDYTQLGVKNFRELVDKRAKEKEITPKELISRALVAYERREHEDDFLARWGGEIKII